jgi:hypothetical protein
MARIPIGNVTPKRGLADGYQKVIVAGRRCEAGKELVKELHSLGAEAEFVNAEVAIVQYQKRPVSVEANRNIVLNA